MATKARKVDVKAGQEPAPVDENAPAADSGVPVAPVPADQEAKLDQAIEEWKKHDKSNLQVALDVGMPLLVIKESFKGQAKGEWGAWLKAKAEARGVDIRTLQRAMQLSRYHQQGDLNGVAGLQAGYDRIAELRSPQESKKRKRGGPISKGELTSGKMSRTRIAEKIREMSPGKETVPAVEIKVSSEARLRTAIDVLKKNSITLLKHGAVIFVKPVVSVDEKTSEKAGEQ
jgi:hypothetical protein